MKKTMIGLAIAGVLGLTSFAASAEEAFTGSWYAVPGVSLMHPDSDLDADNTGAGGFLRLGKELSEHWDVQIGAGHARADEDTGIAGVGGRYKQTLLGVDALYLFSREKFRPFLLAGVGAARNKIDYSGLGITDDSKTSWMANVGIGAQYLFTDNFGIQADLRHVWSKAEAKFAGAPDFDETIGNTYLNLGAIFRFGAPKPTVAAAEPTPEPTPVAAAPAAEPAPAPVGPAEPAFEKITLASEVLFAFDKDTLKPEGKSKLDDEVVGKMKAHPEVELLLITGHTDRISDAKYNQNLSERRANQVKKYLVSQGIEENRLHAVGKGENEPVVDCKGVRGKKAIECLQPNRRVVVEIEVQRAGN
jgi:OOP family OmpA-OmpF porin